MSCKPKRTARCTRTKQPMTVTPPQQPVAECPAYDRCKAHNASCDVCFVLSVADWQEHVRKVLLRA